MFNSHKHDWSKWKDVSWNVWKGLSFSGNGTAWKDILMKELIQVRKCLLCGEKELKQIRPF